jgi:hypothetical protein
MKRSAVSKILVVLVVGLLICSFFEFLAYTDIYHDYVSKNVIKSISPGLISSLPWWSATAGEWSLANASFFIRTILTMLLLILTLRQAVLSR